MMNQTDANPALGMDLFLKSNPAEMDAKAFCSYKKGQQVYLPHQQARHLYLIVKGCIKISTFADDGQEMVRSVLFEEEIFGEEAIASPTSQRDAYAVAQEEKTILYRLSVDAFNILMSTDPDLGKKLIVLMAQRVTQTAREKEVIKLKSAYEKVISYLKDTATRRGKKVGFETMFESNLTHKDIANLLGISRQTVTSLLNSLKKRNLINFNRKRFLIRDLSKLA